MAKKEMYTREEVMTWVVGFVQEKVSENMRGEGKNMLTIAEYTNILDELNVQGMLTKHSADLLKTTLEYYHDQWVAFYQEHYEGLALMTRVHDSLSYYYEAWYYFCRPGTYNLD